MTQNRLVDTFYPARISLIDRTSEMRMIVEAINSPSSCAIYIIGEGGIGKTRLLEEVLSQRDYLASRGVRCSNLIDLYHPEFHNPDNVQFHIAEQIDPQNRFFQVYRDNRMAFLSAEEKGVDRNKLTELAEKRDHQFLEDYKALVEFGKARILLPFDTTEQIQHESETIQALSGLRAQTLAIHTWLVNQAPKLPNTVILLAGRPKPEIETQIQEGFVSQGWNFQRADLTTFARHDAFTYIDALLQEQPLTSPLSDEQKDWIFSITRGKPIRLALALQYIHYLGIGALQARVERGEELDKILVEHLIDLPGEYGGAMHYMLLARNGMDPLLLKHLTGWPDEQIVRYFREMQANVLFKPRSNSLYLHDELYELHDCYFRDDPRTARGYATIAAYYQARLEEKQSYREMLELRIQALFYELQQHPEQGYQQFSVWDEEAIWLHFKGADLRMRDEMLRFTARYLRPISSFYDERMAEQVSAQMVDAESAIRYIERETAEERFDEAIQLAESIKKNPDPLFASRIEQDPLYRARVLYGWAEAALYSGRTEAAKGLLEEVISLLENFKPANDAQAFWKARTLGRGYNRFGFYYRMLGYYARSIPYYRRAVTEFRRAKLDYMLAQTLTNLAYMLALTGDLDTAFEHVQTSRKIWEKFGMTYRLALTLSAMARILVEAEKPIAARKELERAREIVAQIDDQEATIQLMISEGRALRKQGNLWKDELAMYPPEEAHTYLQQGENILMEAENLAGSQAKPLTMWEIKNELGSLYCDWAWLHRKQGRNVLASTCYMNSIKYQEQALTIVHQRNMAFQLADSLDDLAQIRGDRAFFLLGQNRRDEALKELVKAEQCLAEAELTVPDNFRMLNKTGQLNPAALEQNEANHPVKQSEGAPFWLVLGKANMWRGVWKFRMLESEGRLSLETSRQEIEQATEHLLMSQVYFNRYNQHSPQVERNLRYLSTFISAINPPFEWIDTLIKAVEAKYQFTLTHVRTRMENKLGL